MAPLKEFSDADDYQFDNGPWHSQTVSAALTPPQRKAANDLFAQGFDLYKGGDFTGAQTLIDKGLETDPANYLAWFTLGEINRAAWRTKADRDAAKTAFYDYQRVIDLAPKDDAKAFLAANYLKPGGMN
jgi:tetratricopeptide (TPR) repeat protein